MTYEKFQTEIHTLKKFVELYCNEKHENQQITNITLEYKDKSTQIELNLCEECLEIISYSYKRLQECPHEIKPRCRKCPNPCYEKPKWINMSRIMRYSGPRLGLVKVKQKLKKLFTS